jgi:hypothetical protein
MRIVIVVLGILGAFGAGFIGGKWLSDASANAETIQKLEEYEKSLAATGNKAASDKVSTQMAGLKGVIRSAYLLVGGCIAGLAGCVLFLLNKVKPQVAGIILLASALVPAIFEPKSLIFTFCLIIAGGLCLLRKSQGTAAEPTQAAVAAA